MTDEGFDAWVRAGTFSGAGVATLGGLSLSTWLSIFGVAIAAGTLFINWWHKRQMVKIARERLDREFPIKEVPE